ncbi:MAG TPA: SDR family oxidoreductase [Rubrivivax sp.]
MYSGNVPNLSRPQGSPALKIPTALITGASSGIGEALARCFAAGGYRLVLVARGEAKLRALAGQLTAEFGVQAAVHAADLSQPAAAALLAAALRRKRIAVDVLVNNAGVLEQGPFAAMAAERHQALIDLNVSGLTAMLGHFVPPMLRRGQGRVLNVASIAAFQPVPTLATYAATKAYVLSLTETLAEELAGTGVTVTALCPGITATTMLTKATAANPQLAQLPRMMVSEVDAVAREGYRACLAGEVISVPGALNQALVVGGRIAPRWLVRRVAGAAARSQRKAPR